MLQTTYKQFIMWLEEIKEEMDLGNLPDGDETAQEVNFND